MDKHKFKVGDYIVLNVARYNIAKVCLITEIAPAASLEAPLSNMEDCYKFNRFSHYFKTTDVDNCSRFATSAEIAIYG